MNFRTPCSVTLGLEKDINDISILIYGPRKIMLLTINLHEDFIDVEGVTVSSVFAFPSAGIETAKLDTPQTDRFTADGDTSLGQQIFNIAVTQVESVVEPDGVADNIEWGSVAFICVHPPILAISGI